MHTEVEHVRASLHVQSLSRPKVDRLQGRLGSPWEQVSLCQKWFRVLSQAVTLVAIHTSCVPAFQLFGIPTTPRGRTGVFVHVLMGQQILLITNALEHLFPPGPWNKIHCYICLRCVIWRQTWHYDPTWVLSLWMERTAFLDGVCLGVWLSRPTEDLTEESLLTPAADRRWELSDCANRHTCTRPETLEAAFPLAMGVFQIALIRTQPHTN